MVELKKLAQKKDTNQLLVAKRWDKLREWRMLQADIEEKLKNPENFDTGLTLEIGPQLLHTLRHRSILQCMNHSTSKFGDVFTTHYNKGAIQRISVWLLESTSRDSVCEQQWFDTPYELKCLTYIAKRRVYVGFSTDLYLRLFTDGNSNFTELSHFLFMDTVLCLVYNREEEEIYAGGVGIIEEWKIIGAEHAATLVPGKKFITTDISRNDWIRDVKLDRVNNQMFAVHGNGILVFNFRTRKQTHRIPNRHESPLKCCCYFPQYDYLITGGGDGKIRIFNATSFHLLHIIIGHYGPVTSVVPHQKDNLLFSCSYDGTVRLWRMDSLRVFTRLEVGEKIYSLSLLGDSEFFFQTEKNIMIYTQNEFYQFFTSIESESYKLICCRGRGKHNRIIVSAEDGSIRVFSPVTGLSLTIMYPMPTFQIFTQFAYDLHQNRLYTVVQGGKVLSYNTATNPAQCVEMLEPSEIDEEVTNLLLVTVEFMCDKVADADNLLFAGLNNGQIILCEALVCTLTSPVQAHEGALTCFEACTPAAEGGSQVTPSANILVTGGKDCYVKVWLMSVSCKTMHPLVEFSILIKIYLPCVPLYLCMYSQLLAVCVKTNTSVGVRWRLVIYLLSCRKDKWKTIMERSTGTSKMVYSSWITLLQIAHPPDEDHVFELTALDKCPVMNFFLTAGKDGFVKIWNSENKLLRELNFATPIYASCFANDRGDILVGFGTHVCSVSVINYLPLEELVKLHQSSVLIHIKDDGREFPVQFDHEAEPWIDLEKIKLYPVSLQERRKLKLEEEILEKLKRINEKEQTAKFVIFNDGDTTRVIRKDFADRLLTWARGKTKAKLGLIAAAPSPVDQVLKAKDSPVKTIQTHRETGSKAKVDESSEEETVIAERKYLDSEKLIEIYPPTVGQALQYLEFQKSLGPTEMRLLEEKKLLERDPIIAPDGYIPNSVIRQKLKPPEPPVVKIERRWKLKPVPKPEEKHMPLGFEFVTRWKEKTPRLRKESTGISERVLRLTPSPKQSEEGSPTTVSPELVSKPQSPTYKMRDSKGFDNLKAEIVQMRIKAELDKMKATAKGEEEETEKSKGKKRKSFYEVDIVQSLLAENWMPAVNSSIEEYEDVVRKLITQLDDTNPVVYGSCIDYLAALFKRLGMADELIDIIIAKLSENLDSVNTAIKMFTLKGLQEMGTGRQNVLKMVLRKLIDEEDIIRKAAADALLILSGVKNKEELLNLFEQLGLVTRELYNSKEDEEFAFKVLAERFAERTEDPTYVDKLQERILDWVERTTPGLISRDMTPDLEQLWKEGTRSGKSSMYKSREQSFMSEKSDEVSSKELSGKDVVAGSRPESKRDSRRERRGLSRETDSRKTDYRSTIQSRQREGIQSRQRQVDDRSVVSERSTSSRGSKASDRFPSKRFFVIERKPLTADGKEGQLAGEEAGLQIMEHLSEQDSGISRDIADRGKDWRKFLELPTAVERHKIELIKHEMAQGKLKQTSFPPITYFDRDLPMLPAEAGTRLLQTVRVGEKVPTSGVGRHRVEPVPGKLAVHTKNESEGRSCFGIIQMEWTTGVPTVKDPTYPPQLIPRKRPVLDDYDDYLPPLTSRYTGSQLSHLDRLRQGTSEAELHLPDLFTASTTPTVPHRLSPSYEWELPLPPPPAKESRTIIPYIKKEHDTYCKYYQMVKKKLHLYTSKQRERSMSLPTVVARSMGTENQTIDGSQHRQSRDYRLPATSQSRDPKLLLGPGQTLPPLKLGQLINI